MVDEGTHDHDSYPESRISGGNSARERSERAFVVSYDTQAYLVIALHFQTENFQSRSDLLSHLQYWVFRTC